MASVGQDEDSFQIARIGQGAFAVVWHRPSDETRAMKPITFDKIGLVEYLTRN